MSRTKEDIARMQGEDTAVGLSAHYIPLANIINQRGYKTGIEIGTAYGGCANYLMSHCDIKRLACIDPYKYYPPMPGLFDQDDYDRLKIQTYDRLIKYKAFEPFLDDSKAGFKKIKEMVDCGIWDKFDFVFIDGLHEYETIKWECEHYQNLLKEGGALMGHDYNIFEDVNRAVDEFAKGKELFTLPGNIWYINY